MFTEAELRVTLEAVQQEIEAIKDACEAPGIHADGFGEYLVELGEVEGKIVAFLEEMREDSEEGDDAV